ncbi:AI-2E family transporter [Nocardioides ungokensis]|uniref:AI-2E family transporter n=1 Tax=Nocardioides ungokensis TaxID=1643322 RepID=UPI0015DF7A0A|nr:AI-2E family transporter [Nocardioides ungokensis]
MSSESTQADPVVILPRVVVLLLGLAGAFVAVFGMRSMSGLIGGTFLALVFTVAVHPLRGWTERKGLPAWVGGVLGIVLIYLVLIALTVALIVAVARFATLVPHYKSQIDDQLANLTNWLSHMGIDRKQIDSIEASLSPDKLVTLAGSFINALIGVISSFFFVVTLVLFMVMDAVHIPSKLTHLPPERQLLVGALSDFASTTRKYLIVSTVFGLIVAIADVGALLVIGVPVALLWGLLSFITNYIPNIGFIIGVVPPAVIGLLEGGPKMALAVVISYSVINFVIQSVIQPKIVGDSVGLSATLTMISLVFWAFTLGAIGALMAVPLTLLVKALLVDSDARLRWLDPLLAGAPRG